MISFGSMAPQMASLTRSLNGAGGSFSMPKGGLMGILSGNSDPQGLLGMLRGLMQGQGNPFPTPIGGQETGSNANPFPTPVGSPFPTPIRPRTPMPRPRPQPMMSPTMADLGTTPEAAGVPANPVMPTMGDWGATPSAYGLKTGGPMTAWQPMPFGGPPNIPL